MIEKIVVILWIVVTVYMYGYNIGKYEATEIMLAEQAKILESWRLDLEKCLERCP